MIILHTVYKKLENIAQDDGLDPNLKIIIMHDLIN